MRRNLQATELRAQRDREAMQGCETNQYEITVDASDTGVAVVTHNCNVSQGPTSLILG